MDSTKTGENKSMDNASVTSLGLDGTEQDYVIGVFIGRDIHYNPIDRVATTMPGVYTSKIVDPQTGIANFKVELYHGEVYPIPIEPTLYGNAYRSEQFALAECEAEIKQMLADGLSSNQIYEKIKADGKLLPAR